MSENRREGGFFLTHTVGHFGGSLHS